MFLSIKNKHERDDHIQFDEPTHVYTIDGDSKYMSVTTWIHSFFNKFDADNVLEKMRKGKNWNENNKYFHMTNKEIKDEWSRNGKEASELGTEMHLNLEYYYNGVPFKKGFTDTKEYQLFQLYLKDHSEYKAYRTEMTVYSKKYKLAGSIDMIYIDPDDSSKFIIADWKRSKEIKFENKWQKGKKDLPLNDIDDCNYWHYLLQLNVYRLHLEKYYGMEISRMFLVILHPNQNTYQKINIPNISKPIMKMLEYRKKELSCNN